MQSYSFDRPLIITPGKSSFLTLIVVLSHVLVTVFIWTILSADMLISTVLTGLVTSSLVYYYQWHISKNLQRSVLRAVHSNSNKQSSWTVCLPETNNLAVELLPSSFVSLLIVMLNFKDQNNRRYSLIVPADAVSKEEHRQLRVVVKILS